VEIRPVGDLEESAPPVEVAGMETDAWCDDQDQGRRVGRDRARRRDLVLVCHQFR
jgi:hypothetical protein